MFSTFGKKVGKQFLEHLPQTNIDSEQSTCTTHYYDLPSPPAEWKRIESSPEK